MSGPHPRRFGPFLLLERIGEGGFGSVWLGVHHLRRDRLIVVKTLRADLLQAEEPRRRFRHEAKISVALDSPMFARVYQAGEVDGVPYLAMEHVVGLQLKRMLVGLARRKVRLPLEDAATIALRLLEAVDGLHGATDARGRPLEIVHRDLSPSNAIITQRQHLKLIDLGVGRSALHDFQTRTGAVVGSPGYLSPEQVEAKPVDQRCDQFAAAAIIWELFAGRRLIPKGPIAPLLHQTVHLEYPGLAKLRPSLPRAIDGVLERALRRRPSDRHASVRALQLALDPIVSALVNDPTELDVLPFGEVFEPDQSPAFLAGVLARVSTADTESPSEEPTVYATVAESIWITDSMIAEVRPQEEEEGATTTILLLRKASGSVWTWVLLALLVLGGLSFGFVMGRAPDRPSPPIQIAPKQRDRPVSVTQRETSDAVEAPPDAGARASPSVPTQRTPERRARRVTTPKDRRDISFDALLARAQALQRGGSNPELSQLLSDLAFESRRRDPARLREIDARLRQLEDR